jgi:hypothetical protein
MGIPFQTEGMSLMIHYLEIGDGFKSHSILEDTKTGEVFGCIFDGPPETVAEFLAWLDPRDPRKAGMDPGLFRWWKGFQHVYGCSVCGAKGEIAQCNLTFSPCCRLFHCEAHKGSMWTDGKEHFGHSC